MSELPPLSPPCGGPRLAELRRFDTGELSPAESARVRAHADGCAACAAVLRDFTAERAALRVSLPLAVLEARLGLAAAGRRPRLRWPRLAAALALPVAAAAVFALLPAAPDAGRGGSAAPETEGLRLKGGEPRLGFVVRTADGSREGREGEPLGAGDEIRLRYAAAGAPYALIVGVDADGRVTPYFAAGDRSAPAEPGLALTPDAIAFDGDPRPERIFAVFTAEPLAVDELVPAARDALAAAGGRLEAVDRLPLPGQQATLLVNKRSAP